ncbi:MAG: hypothetical protein SVX43_21970, partial [Cyanobacteriota bacterium]|nr:hypothetical protein [Cyanobacteriota bacterium]
MRLFQRFFGKSQPPRQKPQGFSQTFILEPILTPSGLVNGPDDGLDFDLPNLDNSDIASLIADPIIDDTSIEPVNFFDPDSDPDLGIEIDADKTPEIDSDIALNSPDDSDNAGEFASLGVDNFNSQISLFEKGVFTVGDSGEVGIDFLFDGGKYQGELAIFSLEGMDDFDFNDPEDFRAFMQEASERALSDSEMGRVVISDKLE